MKKILALLLVFTFVFAFSACKSSTNVTTTAAAATTTEATTAAVTTVPSDTTTAAVTTLSGETTTAATTLPGQTTTAPAVTTTKPAAVTIKAPVGGTISQIVAFYNQYANATKAYKGTVTVSGQQGTTTTITSVTGGSIVKDLAQKMIPNNFKPMTTKTFKNGTEVGGTSTLLRTLPRDKAPKMSILEPSGVKSATCVKSGSGWKVFITLKEEVCTDINAVPRYHGECMDTLSLTADDLKPFTLVSATVVYSDKTTITAVVNAKGLLDSVGIYEPDNLTGVLKYSFININAVLTGTWQQYLNFKY